MGGCGRDRYANVGVLHLMVVDFSGGIQNGGCGRVRYAGAVIVVSGVMWEGKVERKVHVLDEILNLCLGERLVLVIAVRASAECVDVVI